jgi:hypothetical protein
MLMFDPSAAADRGVLNFKLSTGWAKHCAFVYAVLNVVEIFSKLSMKNVPREGLYHRWEGGLYDQDQRHFACDDPGQRPRS